MRLLGIAEKSLVQQPPPQMLAAPRVEEAQRVGSIVTNIASSPDRQRWSAGPRGRRRCALHPSDTKRIAHCVSIHRVEPLGVPSI
jgi:hypothetical protein